MSSPRNSKLGTVCSVFECSMRSDTNLLSTKITRFAVYKFAAFLQVHLGGCNGRLLCNEKNWKANPKSVLCNKHFITGNLSKDSQYPDYVQRIFSCMEDEGSSSSVN
ncbi:hypothetical protein TNIN_359311 [Trichonephila inaurata madagascariensis]|uniref:THAP-type domain-containing protein n=1 Tax=Trichonephila inaurata madagascariensis TaxID=2747483 RepID=A0A8X7CPJ6_9ARAC|nr:hypothetical protein TNIN_263171 [Trichonephila inaurata madagascariensis]GFY73340.1 hypothetical protein TNIN_359311 [Trichonephila inaurata madagascariensis]